MQNESNLVYGWFKHRSVITAGYDHKMPGTCQFQYLSVGHTYTITVQIISIIIGTS